MDTSEMIAWLQEKLIESEEHLTALDAEIIVGRVVEVILSHQRTDTLLETWKYRLLSICIGVSQQNGYMHYNSYSENGLSMVIDKYYITREFVAPATPRR